MANIPGQSGIMVDDPSRGRVPLDSSSLGGKNLIGELFAQPSTYQSINTGAGQLIQWDTVYYDTLGIYSSEDKSFTLPANVISFDWEVSVELANVASGYGNISGFRAVTLPALIGMGTIKLNAPVQAGTTAGGGTVRGFGMGVVWDEDTMGTRSFTIKFAQDSGSTIRIGNSTGETGTGQTFFKMRLYSN